MMKIEIFLLCAVCTLVQCIPDLSSMCTQVEQLDCNVQYVPERYETICASNNQTYNNFCFYGQVRCKFPDVHVLGVGTCEEFYRALQPQTATPMPTTPTKVMPTLTTIPPSIMPTMTTVSPITTTMMPTTTVDHVKEAFCKSKDVIACPTELDPICASDKTFYLNKCEFSKATCDNLTLIMKDIPFCTGVRK